MRWAQASICAMRGQGVYLRLPKAEYLPFVKNSLKLVVCVFKAYAPLRTYFFHAILCAQNRLTNKNLSSKQSTCLLCD